MAQGVHAGRGRDSGGQLLCHGRVQNDVICDHMVIHDPDLELLFRHGHDRVRRGLRPGSGCCGDHERSHGFLSQARVIEKLLYPIRIRGQYARQLSRVHHAPAPDCHDEISAGALKAVRRGLRLLVGGFRRQIVKNHGLLPGFPDPLQRQFQKARAGDPLIGKYSDLFYFIPDQAGYLIKGVFTAVDSARHFQIIACQHSFFPPLSLLSSWPDPSAASPAQNLPTWI